MSNSIKYKKFELPLLSDKDKIVLWLNKFNIANYTINDDFTVDVDGDVTLDERDVHQLRVQFGHVSGSLNAQLCKLKTLMGAPKTVGKNLILSANSLESLEYCTQHVGEKFYCNSNKIKSLVHGPQYVGSVYGCFRNQLENLSGAPERCASIIASYNKMKSLQGSPKHVEGGFFLASNLLKTLDGGPDYVGGEYDVSKNSLESLVGIASYIGVSLDLSSNALKVIDASFQNEMTGKVIIYANPINAMQNQLSWTSSEFKKRYLAFSLENNLNSNATVKKNKI